MTNSNQGEFDPPHYHDQRRKETARPVKMGRYLVTTQHTYCSQCGKWMKSKPIHRQKIEGN